MNSTSHMPTCFGCEKDFAASGSGKESTANSNGTVPILQNPKEMVMEEETTWEIGHVCVAKQINRYAKLNKPYVPLKKQQWRSKG
ncbi:hypothetical protein HAX54_006497 [Datura stramonium]|uniref:Uncharacterized protein n=1 Tax=Datura stramonium TaxID=4076 RepID=A0ABS8WU39_DATST|nr:hypothetical protein [Datura stramonium]